MTSNQQVVFWDLNFGLLSTDTVKEADFFFSGLINA